MAVPKILVIPGSLRAKSYNVRLAALASKELTLADADVTRISLEDYPLPIYEADTTEKSGPPHNALKPLRERRNRVVGELNEGRAWRHQVEGVKQEAQAHP